ncbi:MAG: GIDE domain-containing protein [Candidatus Rifleibacteriota bacterium]
MNYPEYFVLGSVFIVGDLFLFYRALRIKLRIKKIANLPVTSIAKLDKKFLGKIVKIRGKVLPTEKIEKAPYSDRECLFHHSIRKDLVEHENKFNTNGEKNYYTYLTMEEFKSSKPFFIKDSTGEVLIYPENIFIDGRRIIGGDMPDLIEIWSKDGTQFDFDFEPDRNAEKRKKLEQILIPKQTVMAVGELVFNHGQITLISPENKNEMGFVTVQTLTELTQKSNRQFNTYIAVILFFLTIGVSAIYYSLIS